MKEIKMLNLCSILILFHFGVLFVNAQPTNTQNVTSTPTPSNSGSEGRQPNIFNSKLIVF